MDDKQREELREVFHSGNTYAAKRTMLDMSADVRLRFIEAKDHLSSDDYSAFLFVVSCLLEEARHEVSNGGLTEKLDNVIKARRKAEEFNSRFDKLFGRDKDGN